MMNLFKRSYIPYMSFLVGVVLIFLWVRSRRVEGFENADGAYAFKMYYAEWCPHCQTAKPEFAKLGATQTIGGKKVMMEAIDAEKHPEKVQGKVEGYPTIHLYDAKGNLVKEYSGPRTHDAFLSFLKDSLA